MRDTSRALATPYSVFNLDGALFEKRATDCNASDNKSRHLWLGMIAALKARLHLRQGRLRP